jgi:phosphopantothenoylcysteine decarboxylase
VGEKNRGVLYLIACASPRARKLTELVELAHSRAWTVNVIATPEALKFIDRPRLERQTGFPVRSSYEPNHDSIAFPPADAMLVCPATFNTVNKWALGIADNLALSLLTEAVGLSVPLVAAPALNNAQERHPAFVRSVGILRELGVRVLYGSGVYEPTMPGTGGRAYDWGLALGAVEGDG